MEGEAIDEQAKDSEEVEEIAAEGQEPQSPNLQPEEPPLPPEWKSWLVVAILVGIYLNSFLDRQIMGLLVEDIKASLGASDTQMGLLTGIAFAFFYAMAGLPIGYLVDRKKRTWIIIVGQLFWTLASFSCGLAGKFWQLFIFRFGVGVGEATLSPSAYSIVADSFHVKKIALALGVYGMGVTLGANIANLLGAWAVGLMEPGVLYDVGILGERYRWQIVFFMICLPTIPLTILMLVVKEPLRRSVKRIQAADGTWEIAKPPKGELQRYLKKNWKTVICHNVGFAWLAFSGYGIGAWLPAFYMRIHGLSASQAGYVLGTVGIIFGTAGTVFGGWLADKLYARGYRDAKIRLGLCTSLCWIPFGVLYPFMPTIELVVLVGLVPAFVGAMTIGVQAAAVQEMMPNSLRGRASAIFLFFNSLIGLGLGPLAVGMATDFLFQDEMRVHHSIALVGLFAHIMAATFLFIGLKHYRKTLDDLPAWIEGQE
jgi:MFS family permease